MYAPPIATMRGLAGVLFLNFSIVRDNFILEVVSPLTMPKTVYIAHQLSGNVQENVKAVLKLLKDVHDENIVPVAPYLVSVQYLDDSLPEERLRGIASNQEFFVRKVIDELWLCGPTLSKGMKEEITLSKVHGIPIKCHNAALQEELNTFLKEIE